MKIAAIRRHIVAVVLLSVLPIAAQVVSPGWHLPHYDNARTNFNPNEILLGPSNLGTLSEVWSFPTCRGLGESPAVANGIAYATSSCFSGPSGLTLTLYAVNASTGALIWRRGFGTTSESCAIPYPPGVSGNTVFVGSCAGMVAFEARTGALLWQNSAVAPVRQLVLEDNGVAAADGPVYFIGTVFNGDEKLYALDAATGEEVWSFAPLHNPVGTPAVANGFLYVTGQFAAPAYALDARTGARNWTSQLIAGSVLSSPAVANGVLYISAYAGGVQALDAATGALLWASLDLHDVLGTVGAAYGKVFLTIQDHDSGPRATYALDAQTGATAWQVPDVGGPFSATIANHVVYVNGGGYIYAFDAATGAALAVFGAGQAGSSPVVANGMVYFTGGDGLHAYGIAH